MHCGVIPDVLSFVAVFLFTLLELKCCILALSSCRALGAGGRSLEGVLEVVLGLRMVVFDNSNRG